jgi:hypothetical protein
VKRNPHYEERHSPVVMLVTPSAASQIVFIKKSAPFVEAEPLHAIKR